MSGRVAGTAPSAIRRPLRRPDVAKPIAQRAKGYAKPLSTITVLFTTVMAPLATLQAARLAAAYSPARVGGGGAASARACFAIRRVVTMPVPARPAYAANFCAIHSASARARSSRAAARRASPPPTSSAWEVNWPRRCARQ